MAQLEGDKSLCNDTDWSGRSDCEQCGIHNDVLLEGKSGQELDRVLRPVTAMQLAPRDVIYREGDSAESVFVLRKGLVKLINYLHNGKPRIVRLHRQADVIGIEGLMSHPYEHSAVAVSDAEICRVPVAALQELKEHKPDLYCVLIERWYQYLQRADTWITEFSTGSVRARVARLISFLSEIEDVQPDQVELLSGEDMAAILGCTVESVSRVVAELKRDQVLRPVDDTGSRELYVHNDPALDEIAVDEK